MTKSTSSHSSGFNQTLPLQRRVLTIINNILRTHKTTKKHFRKRVHEWMNAFRGPNLAREDMNFLKIEHN